jgi:hypothetical protein
MQQNSEFVAFLAVEREEQIVLMFRATLPIRSRISRPFFVR